VLPVAYGRFQDVSWMRAPGHEESLAERETCGTVRLACFQAKSVRNDGTEDRDSAILLTNSCEPLLPFAFNAYERLSDWPGCAPLLSVVETIDLWTYK